MILRKTCTVSKARLLINIATLLVVAHSLISFNQTILSIHVFCWRRRASLIRLLASLNIATDTYNLFYQYYTNPPLVFHIDRNYSTKVAASVERYLWAFGPKFVRYSSYETPYDHEASNVGMRLEYLPLAIDAISAKYHLLLEDDIVLSPISMVYVEWCLKFLEQSSLAGVVGCSLSTPKLDELNFNTPEPLHLFEKYNKTHLLIQIPSSWGVIYRQDFLLHLQATLREPLHDFAGPANLRFLEWKHSWKRHAFMLIIKHNYTVVYPNFINATSFARHVQVLGVHSASPHDVVYRNQILSFETQLDLQEPESLDGIVPLFTTGNKSYVKTRLYPMDFNVTLLDYSYREITRAF